MSDSRQMCHRRDGFWESLDNVLWFRQFRTARGWNVCLFLQDFLYIATWGNMHYVQTERITNIEVLTKFKVPPLFQILRKRQLAWLEKIAKMEDSRIPKIMSSAWCQCPRKRGKPLKTPRASLCDALRDVIPFLDDNILLDDWIPCARDKNVWDSLYVNYLPMDLSTNI